jgi:hypothetical protein
VVAEKRDTGAIRAYADTLEEMRDEQTRVRKAGKPEPTYADLIEAAWQEYKKEDRPMLVGSKYTALARRLHMMLDYLLEAGPEHAEACRSNLEVRMAAAVVTKDFSKANIDRLVAEELTAYRDRS